MRTHREQDRFSREAGESKESDRVGGSHGDLGENPGSAPDPLCDRGQLCTSLILHPQNRGSSDSGLLSGGGTGAPSPGNPSSLLNPPPHSFLIGEDGLVYEGRGWDTQGAHAGGGWNSKSIGISFMGNYMGK